MHSAEKVQEIVSWLKAHPVSLLSRSSCDLQILDSAIVEKIEEEVANCKVGLNMIKNDRLFYAMNIPAGQSRCFLFCELQFL